MIVIAAVTVALLGVGLFVILRTDLEKAKKGGKSKFWEVEK